MDTCVLVTCNLHTSRKYLQFTVYILYMKRYITIVSSSSAIYVCTLDASKTFDRVNLLTLVRKLHNRSMCLLFLRFLMHNYCNQKMRIKWNSALSGTFNTSNGVKQGVG